MLHEYFHKHIQVERVLSSIQGQFPLQALKRCVTKMDHFAQRTRREAGTHFQEIKG